MTPIPRDAPASIACGRSGLPLLAACANGHRRTLPFRLLATHDGDPSLLYGRRLLCRQCGSRDVTLYAFESQAELDTLRPEVLPAAPAVAPTNYRRHDSEDDLP